MDAALVIRMIFKVVGGLGIFLLGMKRMSEGLQTVAGSRLRAMIGAVTNNRFTAVAVGTGVTCLIQSSSVTTVMVVGFVNAGFMTLSQAIGVIMGANIGTTITGWIIAMKIDKYGLPLLGVSALLFLFSKRDRTRYFAMATMGVGMIFFGLVLMKEGFTPIRDTPDFKAWFHAFEADSYWGVIKCALAGGLLTMIVQSSSATLVITIALASTGVIRFESATALVLGENIGTTITAYLASLGANTNAKRAAYAHVIMKVLGVILMVAIFFWYVEFVKRVIRIPDPNAVAPNGELPHMAFAIASGHTIFNIANTLIFLPLVNVLARFLTRLVPEPAFKETPHLTRLDQRMLEAPVIGIEQCRQEILRMANVVRKTLSRLRTVLTSDQPDQRDIEKIFHREEVTDIMQTEVTVFLTDLLGSSVAHEVADEARRMLRIADEYESVGDYITNILKLRLRLDGAGLSLAPENRTNLLSLHDEVADYVTMINVGCQQQHPEIVSKAHTRGDGITHRIRELRAQHLAAVADNGAHPLTTTIYIDLLNGYRRVKDHAMNVAEALAGEK